MMFTHTQKNTVMPNNSSMSHYKPVYFFIDYRPNHRHRFGIKRQYRT